MYIKAIIIESIYLLYLLTNVWNLHHENLFLFLILLLFMRFIEIKKKI